MITWILPNGLTLKKSHIDFIMGLYPSCCNFENPKNKATFIGFIERSFETTEELETFFVTHSERSIPLSSEQIALLEKWGLA